MGNYEDISKKKINKNAKEKNTKYIFKYSVIGKSYVGKSNLLLRYAHNEYIEDFSSTIGVDFFTKDIKMWNKNCSTR